MPSTLEATAPRQRPRVDFFGMAIDNVSRAEAMKRVAEMISEPGPSRVFCTNVAVFDAASSSPELWAFYRNCNLSTVDGRGIYFALHLLRTPVHEPVSGASIGFHLLEVAAERGYRLFILGARQEVLRTAIENLRREHPGIQIVGGHHGYYSDAEEAAIADLIAESGAQVVLLAMSSPRKERFAERQGERCGANLMVGVGGGIDIVAGVYSLAPPWISAIGAEWLFRLAQEPRRLWRRYLYSNTRFGWRLASHFVGRLTGRRIHPRRAE